MNCSGCALRICTYAPDLDVVLTWIVAAPLKPTKLANVTTKVYCENCCRVSIGIVSEFDPPLCALAVAITLLMAVTSDAVVL